MQIVLNNLENMTNETKVTKVIKATQPIFLELMYGRVQDAESQKLYGIKQIPSKKEYIDQVKKPIEGIIGKQTKEVWEQIYVGSVEASLDLLANYVKPLWVVEGEYERLLLAKVSNPKKSKGTLFPTKVEYTKLAPGLTDFTSCQRYAASKLTEVIKNLIFEIVLTDKQRYGAKVQVLDLGIYVIPY